MRRYKPTELGRELVGFFDDYLPSQRGMSPHTIHSYRDSLLLLLRFVANDSKRRVEQLEINDVSSDRVVKFLKFLETDRKNGIATRNARLSAIHVFARYLAARRPEFLGSLQRVIGIPFKRGERDSPIEYLQRPELDALLKSIDRGRPMGKRDYALFALMFNTGARVQEILNLRRCDMRLDAPFQVRLLGKGNKVRLLSDLASSGPCNSDADRPAKISARRSSQTLMFTNARGKPLTRFGVRYLLRKYVRVASKSLPTMADRRIHPHSLRHSTAVAMLKAGVDFATISQWLGHASLNTTMRYARADIDLKRQALSQVFPDALAPPKGGRLLIDGADLVGWLRRV